MTLSAVSLAVGSALGLLGLAVLLIATVLASVADLTGRDPMRPAVTEARS